jgi:cupin fold WbuC family metalloprotein
MKVFSSQYFDDLLATATLSQRLRAHTNIHDSYDDQCQRLFNAINANSYIRPHRHSLDPKTECLIAIRGLFGLIVLTNDGLIELVILFGSEKYSEKLRIASGLELPAKVWHTVVSLADHSILFEVKDGPFDPELAKEYAPWAPEEGSEDAKDYLNKLRQMCLNQLSVFS